MGILPPDVYSWTWMGNDIVVLRNGSYHATSAENVPDDKREHQEERMINRVNLLNERVRKNAENNG